MKSFLTVLVLSSAMATKAVDEYWVAPDGKSNAAYTQSSPGSIADVAAARAARKNRDKTCMTVVFAPGTYSFAKLFPKVTAKNHAALELWSEGCTNIYRGATGKAEDVIFDGKDFPTRAMSMNGVTANFVEGITFRNFRSNSCGGDANDCGGAIVVGDRFGFAYASIRRCVFERNYAEKNGGAVWGSVQIWDSKFVQNVAFRGTAGAFFGSLLQACKPRALAENCTFIDNAAPEYYRSRLSDTTVAGWCDERNSTIESWRRDLFGQTKGPFVNAVRSKPGDDLLAARDRLRQKRDRGKRAEIVLADGVYLVTNRVTLSGLDSRLTLRAEHPGKAVFVNGFTLKGSDFRRVSGSTKLAARLPEAARKVALMAEVPAAYQKTLTNEIRPQLAVDGTSLKHARWPNVGGIIAGKEVKNDRFKNWKFDAAVEAFGMTGQYTSGGAKVSGCDATTGVLDAKGIQEKRRVYFHGPVEEIDSPGEWAYADGKIVLWPPESFTSRSLVTVATSGSGFFHVTGDGVRLEGIAFVASLAGSSVVTIGGGSRGASVVGCSFAALRGDAVSIDAFDCTVQSCDFTDIGGTGVSVKGGDKRRLKRGGNVVDNCLFERVCKTHDGFATGAINLDGVESRVSHCVVHDIREHAMDWGGYACVVEYCRFYEANLEFRDSGVVYAPGGARSYGCHFRFNDLSGSPGLSHGIYPDDMSSGHLIYGNVVRNVGWGGIFLGGGRNNVISNNVVVGAGSMALHNDNRGLFWPAWENREKLHQRMIDEYDYVKGPVGQRWPEFARWHDDGKLMFGNLDNTWVYNLAIDTSPTEDQVCLGKAIPLERQISRDNLIIGLRQEARTRHWRFGGFKSLDLRKTPDKLFKRVPPVKMVKREDGLEMYAYEQGDFNLADDCVLKKELPGFTPIPWDKIGLYKDSWRK